MVVHPEGEKFPDGHWVQHLNPLARRSAWCLATSWENSVRGKWWSSWLNKLATFIMDLILLVWFVSEFLFVLKFYNTSSQEDISKKSILDKNGNRYKSVNENQRQTDLPLADIVPKRRLPRWVLPVDFIRCEHDQVGYILPHFATYKQPFSTFCRVKVIFWEYSKYFRHYVDFV